jgi:(S)-mandelate dehydrogenase
MTAVESCYNIADLRLEARRRLPRWIFEFADLGAEDNLAIAENIAAFQRIKLRGKVLVDMTKRDPGAEIFGTRTSLPALIAPTGAAGLCWYEGELALARAAKAAGLPFTMAIGSTTPLEKVAKEAGGQLWFQLYLWENRDLTLELAQKAWDHGYEALVVTVDVGLGTNREHNYRNDFGNPFTPTTRNVSDIVVKPGWMVNVLFRYLATTGMPKHANNPQSAKNVHGSTLRSKDGAVSWEYLKWLRDRWQGKLIVKGILRADDAEQAVAAGVDGIVVSNHGGRVFDSSIAPIDALPAISQAVKGKALVILDSGIRRGSDMVKAYARGADLVQFGRAALWGVAAGGEAGAARAFSLLKREYEQQLSYIGALNSKEIGPDVLAENA